MSDVLTCLQCCGISEESDHPCVDIVLQGGNATAGQVIALSGLSGAVDSPLLHFTYVPNGKIYQSATAVDPVPCFAP